MCKIRCQQIKVVEIQNNVQDGGQDVAQNFDWL